MRSISSDTKGEKLARSVPVEHANDHLGTEALEQAQALRAEGRDVAVLPMRKNMKRQIATLEQEGFTQFEKTARR